MKLSSTTLCSILLLLLSSDVPPMRMGLLQFKVSHTLTDSSCLPNDCYLTMQDDGNTANWLNKLETLSNMAVLHWDRPIPWLAFNADPPAGIDRMVFFDSRIDPQMKAWVNDFSEHFKKMGTGYLAVSILNGNRNGLQEFRINETSQAVVGEVCPVVEPGVQISFQYKSDDQLITAEFDLAKSYTNFILYLNDKLHPDYLALMVETNLYKEMNPPCPERWPSLVRLYHYIYDSIRPQVDPATKVFSTLSLMPLLHYDSDTCNGPRKVVTCDSSQPPPDYDPPDPGHCYPLDLSSLKDLDQGDRIEVLALSFYPDSLLMNVSADNLVKFYPENWDGKSNCNLQTRATPFLDPMEAIRRFNWQKPIGIAELGARSGRVFHVREGYLLSLPADSTSQSFWLGHFLTAAQEERFEFYIQSFSNDYPPIGIWAVQDNYMTPELFSLFNNFALMGLHTSQGNPKGNITTIWKDALQ